MKKTVATVVLALGVILGSVAAADAGRIPSPGSDTFTLNGFQSATYRDTFRGGELAIIEVRGDGRTTLDVFVYDANGNLVVNTAGPGDQCRVSFTPGVNGMYRIVVINRGGGQNRYTMSTN